MLQIASERFRARMWKTRSNTSPSKCLKRVQALVVLMPTGIVVTLESEA
jgi:hypothetical protein